jgi:hypothetical protein
MMRVFTKKHKILIVAVGVTLVILAGLLAAFLVRANHYKTHFFPGTTMSGVDVSELTEQEATDKISRFVADYLLTITTRDADKYYIEGPSIGYSYVPNGEIGRILEEQDSYDWLNQRKTTSETQIELSTSFDEDLLKTELEQLPCMQADQMVAPEDAHIEWVDDGYQLIPEVAGTTLDTEKALALVRTAVENSETTVDLESAYENPQITSEDPTLNACMDNIQKYYGTSITYTFGDEEPYELDSATIQSWLDVDEDFEVSVDDQKVTEFVQFMASTYNTYGDTREFKSSMGDTVKIGGGDYGWVIDKEKEKAQIYEDLAQGGAISREPIYSQTALRYGADDIGDTYIEIDYTNQHLWYYREGELVIETDVVTGNINRGNGSPDGVFKIVYKERNATLVGEGYSSPVDYFMPFAYNVGIHDASWRSTFGGEIYKTSGSHGCINAPADIAEQLFEQVEVGTPVIAYYREKVYLRAENHRISNAYSYISDEKYKELKKKGEL